MRIGIDISQIVYEGTGVATYTRNLVGQLLRLNSTGKHEYILFGTSLRRKNILDQFAKELKNEGLKFKSLFLLLPQTFTTELWNDIHHVKIERLIGKIDLFHSSDWVQPPSKAKKVTTIHDLVVYLSPESSHQKIIEEQKKRLAWVKKECDLIIVDSEATKKDCQKILGIPSNKMKVVHLAAGQEYTDCRLQSTDYRKKEIDRVKKKYHLNKRYILAVGTREPRKNLNRLVEACQKLNLKDNDLIIAGKFGWTGMESSSEKMKQLNNGVKVLGYVPQEDLPALFAGAEVFAYPSLFEGFGIPVLEAMTVGTPVITSNIGSMPEVGGNAAIYANPRNVDDIANKLLKLLKMSKKNKNKLIKKSLAQAVKFSWEKTARETLKVYEELVS